MGGLIAFEAVYLTVLLFRKRGGSWSAGWRPSSFDAVTVVKQLEMRAIVGDDEMPDLGAGERTWREAAGDSLRGLWARSRGWFKVCGLAGEGGAGRGGGGAVDAGAGCS